MATTNETSGMRSRFASENSGARYVNLILSVWLFISAFVWVHSPAQQTNTWICGVLGAIFALVALSVPAVRYLNTVLSIWLFISAFALPTVNVGTVWNNALVAIAMFVVSLVGAGAELPMRRRPIQPA